MQSVRPNESVSDAVVAGLEGAFCTTTRRIAVISAFPAALKQLVAELMTRCYDVLVFHHAQDPVLPLLDNDLVIVDRTTIQDESAPSFMNESTGVLYLVRQTDSGTSGSGRSLVWPGPVQEAVRVIAEITSEKQTVSSGEGDPVFGIAAQAEQMLRFKDLLIDLKRMQTYASGVKIDLTKTEFDLLRLLISAGGVLSRQAIMEALWGTDYFGGSNSIDVHIKSLRQKLGDNPKHPQYIATVRGFGYRIALD
ncbi:winged helix-turn-helix domain-containing protein [Cohnella fermenti]|uniref:Winged helix-turn-helix transcriptional regulator n=1 Tax=Cohnella fermenti TaxID=2565925 RepID=A0A4V3WFA3_9BACL|nr:winged helix-turn-helix domain-containing protein [Cohnella fermenti]THF79560.1 winged helix-turn-helix transcriptional regulator [Cohnella fermenti]